MPFAIAAGHQETLNAAKTILENGGNAVDAAICAFLTSMVVEPCMAGVGGGGLALVREGNGRTTTFDFFCHTPRTKIPRNKEHFYPVTVDFGGALEDFYVGAASVATPGSIAGIYALYDRYGTIPIRELFGTAIDLAGKDVVLDTFQAYDLQLLEGICGASSRGREIYFRKDGTIKKEGDTLSFPHLSDFLEVLSYEGQDFFYKGDISTYIHKISTDLGGHIKSEDLSNYKVHVSEAPSLNWMNSLVHLVGYPSMGSSIIAATLKALEGSKSELFSKADFSQLVESFRSTYILAKDPGRLSRFLKESYQLSIPYGKDIKKGGTTHFSIMDGNGMSVALTASIGEGSGIIIPGTDVHLNNMLGEEALMSKGFYNWEEDVRLISMMSPTIVAHEDGRVLVTGSGGAGRIPYMISLLCKNIFINDLGLEEAVNAPRLYYHDGVVEVEPGFQIDENLPSEINEWKEPSLYFGGTHSILGKPASMQAIADARRYGVAYSVD
jgi:gamma-glutamyltranspeptidase/glutathione hydrolase